MWAARVFSALNSDKEFAEKSVLYLYHSPFCKDRVPRWTQGAPFSMRPSGMACLPPASTPVLETQVCPTSLFGAGD